jgi:hypothetical protein
LCFFIALLKRKELPRRNFIVQNANCKNKEKMDPRLRGDDGGRGMQRIPLFSNYPNDTIINGIKVNETKKSETDLSDR